MDTALLIICVLVACLLIKLYYYAYEHIYLTCIVSSKDGNTYCVRDRPQIDTAVNLLTEVNKRCETLILYLTEKYPRRKDIKRLSTRYKNVKIVEILPDSKSTAYSENKGEKIALCLNTYRNNKSKFIDINTLTFVALHEITHIMTLSDGHKRIFWHNFKFILDNAVEIGIYKPIDYTNNPQMYCGKPLTDNPYYDFVL